MNWIKESNRMKHFFAGFFLGYLLTIIGAILGGLAKEFKDYKFDWLDLLATALGGLVGTLFPVLTYFIAVDQGLVIASFFYLLIPVSWLIGVRLFGGKYKVNQMIKEIKSLFKA